MQISKEWTDAERRVIAALITTECRNAAMEGRYPKGKYGNSESAAVVLCAPAWFLEQQRHSFEKLFRNAPEDSLDFCWHRISRDIKALFPSTNLTPPEANR